MAFNSLKIGDLIAKVPIIQGGMGVGVSRSRLASSVANQGGIGTISGVQIGFLEDDFYINPLEANLRALRKEIKKARELSPKGIIAVNFLMAIQNYNAMVSVAIEEGIDIVVSGAGLPLILPELVKGTKTKIAPIVSSARAAKIILKQWDRKYDTTADLIIVEGPLAGGHLGFNQDDLESGQTPLLKDIVIDVINEIKPFEEKYHKIPVVAAGGIYTKQDIEELLNIGADGVQIATRFVVTEECDADLAFKMAYIDAKQSDIEIIKSPVGMPGRVLNNAFLKNVKNAKQKINSCFVCLKGCNPNLSPYCISEALVNSVKGKVNEGLMFVGSNAFRLNKMTTVKELMQELTI